MSPRRGGWDFAQIRSSFLSDPEFQRLSRSCRNDRDFYAAIGLWTVALAQAWREDSDDVTEVLANYPRAAANLAAAQLVNDGHLAGFAKWTETVRRVRETDADRKRGNKPDSSGQPNIPADSGGNNGSPVEFPRGVGVNKGSISSLSTRDEPEAEVEQRLAQWGVYGIPLGVKLRIRLAGLVEAHGGQHVMAACERIHSGTPAPRDASAYVWAAVDALEAKPNGRKPSVIVTDSATDYDAGMAGPVRGDA